jgi:hypothetical protein
MFDKLTSLAGSLASITPFVGWSDEHRQFFADGYKCPSCHAKLINAMGVVSTNFYAADGKKLSVWAGGPYRADTVECPKCGHRWKRCGANPVSARDGIEVLGIVETDRGEEFLGEDRRVIDNTRSSSPLTRNFTFSKEWSKSCQVELERAKASGKELNFGAKEAAALKLSSEEKLRPTYAITLGSKETATEEVSCTVSGHQKLTVVVRWKRILQHGFIQATQSGLPLRIPFQIAVGMTFDQQQIEESDAASS